MVGTDSMHGYKKIGKRKRWETLKNNNAIRTQFSSGGKQNAHAHTPSAPTCPSYYVMGGSVWCDVVLTRNFRVPVPWFSCHPGPAARGNLGTRVFFAFYNIRPTEVSRCEYTASVSASTAITHFLQPQTHAHTRTKLTVLRCHTPTQIFSLYKM